MNNPCLSEQLLAQFFNLFQIEDEARGVEELTCFVNGHSVSQRILTNKEKVSCHKCFCRAFFVVAVIN